MKTFKKSIIVTLAIAIMLGNVACAANRGKTSDELTPNKSNTREVAADTPAQTTVPNAGTNSYYDDFDAAYEEEYYGEYYGEYSDSSVGNMSYEVDTNNTNFDGQMLIRNVQMDIETSSFTDVCSSIKNSVSELGGYIESSNVSGTGNDRDLRTACYVVRIPTENMDSMIGTVSDNCIIVAESETTEDVTLQYSDIQSQIAALRAEQSILLGILEDTEDVEYIITLQTRLAEISYEIESYESAGRILVNQAVYSTLTLNIEEVVVEVEPEKPEIPEEKPEPTFKEQFVQNMKDSWENIKKDLHRGTLEFAENLPYLIVILGIFAIIGLVVFIVVKIVIKRIKKSLAKAQTNQVKPEEKNENK